MNNNLKIEHTPLTTQALDSVVDTKTAAEILGIKNTADLNRAAMEGYFPYIKIGTAYCYDRNTLHECWRKYLLESAQPHKLFLTKETYETYTRLKENNKLTDEQLMTHLLSLVQNHQ